VAAASAVSSKQALSMVQQVLLRTSPASGKANSIVTSSLLRLPDPEHMDT
jgi:hypothetical protein